jgi:hypothetical protein
MLIDSVGFSALSGRAMDCRFGSRGSDFFDLGGIAGGSAALGAQRGRV